MRVRALTVFVAVLAMVAVWTVPASGKGGGPGSVGALFDAPATINASGGTNATDGLKIVYGSAQLQVFRLGSGQIYDPSMSPSSTTNTNLDQGIYLQVGTTTVGPDQFAYAGGTQTRVDWDTITTTGGSASGSGTITTTLSKTLPTGLYTVAITIGYTLPNDYFTMTAIVTIPAGNTGTVRLYHELDTFLGASDNGPGFFQAGPPAIVGVQQPGVVEAFRYRSGPAWSGYYSAFYDDESDGAPGAPNNGVDYGNTIDPSPSTDNGIAIDYNLGSTPGQTTVAYDLIFSASLAATPVTTTPALTG